MKLINTLLYAGQMNSTIQGTISYNTHQVRAYANLATGTSLNTHLKMNALLTLKPDVKLRSELNPDHHYQRSPNRKSNACHFKTTY